MTQYYVFLLAAGFLIALGMIIYTSIIYRYREALEFVSLPIAIVDIFSHLPDTKSGAAPHVFGSIFFLSGTSLFVSVVIADNTQIPQDQFLGIVLGLASIILSVTFSIVTMWTLWQARRIDFQTGFKIPDFHTLIKIANQELDILRQSYLEVYHRRTQPFHRFYLITTQPFFGTVSYPNSPETHHFRELLSTFAKFAAESDFEFEIICGNKELIENFHRHSASLLKLGDDAANAKWISKNNGDTETDINHMIELFSNNNKGPRLIRARKIPRVQFMVIGNKLFEFTIGEGGPPYEIFNTQVISDRRYISAYLETFSLIKEAFGALPTGRAGVGAADAGAAAGAVATTPAR